MQRTVWALIGLTAIGTPVCFGYAPGEIDALEAVWWAFPLLISLVSAGVLAVTAASSYGGGGFVSTAAASRIYLVPGPSFAILNLVPALELGVSPPGWVGVAMLGILFTSAWIFYKTSRDSEA